MRVKIPYGLSLENRWFLQERREMLEQDGRRALDLEELERFLPLSLDGERLTGEGYIPHVAPSR